MDPRISVIGKRVEKVGRIIAVSGGKGGVGKSVISCLLSVALFDSGYKVGLLDLDLSSPSDHVILGVKDMHPKEENGIVPPELEGIKFMSVTLFAEDKPIPLRGEDISSAIKEILCITRWEELDFLIIDTPPGIGDELFEIAELLRRGEFVLVTIPSKVAFETVKKLVSVLREIKSPVIGIIENMKRGKGDYVVKGCKEIFANYIGYVRFDENLERSLGDLKRLRKTKAFEDVSSIVKKFITVEK